MNQRQVIYVQAMSVSVVIAAILGVTLLGFHGTLDGQSVVAVLGTAIGFAGANVTSVSTLAQAVNGKATMSEASLSHMLSAQAIPTPEPPSTPPVAP